MKRVNRGGYQSENLVAGDRWPCRGATLGVLASELPCRERFRIGIAWLIAASVVALLMTAAADAQPEYEQIEINPRFVLPKESDFESRREYRSEYRKIRSQISDARDNVQDALKSGSTSFSSEGEAYLREYRLAQMTQTDDLYLSNLGRLRSEFLREFLGSRAAPQTRRPMIERILPALVEIVQKNYHPAVRVNAVTLIGLLDEREGDSSEPPTPSPAAYQALTRIWNSADLPEAVKVGALSGIRRFAELSRQGSSGVVFGSDLKDQWIAIATGQAPGQDSWSRDYSYWLQRRATQILGLIGEGADVVAALSTVLKTEPAEGGRDNFWLRYDALEALSNLKFDQLDADQVEPLIDEALQFAAFALEREARELDSRVKDLVYVNILWADTDLEQGGKRPRGRGGARGGGSRGGTIGSLGAAGAGGAGGAGKLGGGGEGPGGGRGGARGGLPGGGGDRGGGRGGNPFGGRSGSNVAAESDKVELPVYELNDSRARTKAVLVMFRKLLKEFRYETGIVTAASQESAQQIRDQLLPAVDELLEKTELGVIDHRELRGEEPGEDLTKDITSRLTQVYRDGAAKLRKLMFAKPDADQGEPAAGGFTG